MPLYVRGPANESGEAWPLPDCSDRSENPVPVSAINRVREVNDEAVGVDLLADHLGTRSSREGPDGDRPARDNVGPGAKRCGVPKFAWAFRICDADPLVSGVRHSTKAQVREAVRSCCLDRTRRRMAARRRAKDGDQEQAGGERPAVTAFGHLSSLTCRACAEGRTCRHRLRLPGQPPDHAAVRSAYMPVSG
jgi:hypothetical protein